MTRITENDCRPPARKTKRPRTKSTAHAGWRQPADALRGMEVDDGAIHDRPG